MQSHIAIISFDVSRIAIVFGNANYEKYDLFAQVAPPHGVFQEVKGESEERRRARFNHHQNTQERMVSFLLTIFLFLLIYSFLRTDYL